MSEYNLSFLELMRTVKDGDRVGCSCNDNDTFLELKGETIRWNHSDNIISQPWAWRYRILKPEPEMVTLTRPKFFMTGRRVRNTEFWYSDKSAFYLNYTKSKVMEWEEITVPKNIDDWRCGDE